MIETIATFEGRRLPNGIYSQSFSNLENSAVSESGKTLTVVTRLMKRTITATYKTSSHEVPMFKEICGRTTGNLVFLGENIRVKPRLQSCNLVEESYAVEGTEGLWETNINFEEV